jgi:hypothetical protein
VFYLELRFVLCRRRSKYWPKQQFVRRKVEGGFGEQQIRTVIIRRELQRFNFECAIVSFSG